MVAPNAPAERFARWHASHGGALLRAVRARCAALRADAVQAAWLCALVAPPPDDVVNDDARLRAWLARIVRRRAIDLKRRQRSHAPLSGTEVARDSAERDERAHLVRAALQRLAFVSAASARLLERHYFDEAPVRELAKELGLTSRVVSARLSRAKKKLRAILEEMGGGSDF